MKFLAFLIFLPAITYGTPEYSTDFLDYIKTCENGIKKGWDGERWSAYHDGSGFHIGYGHLIVKEDYSEGITESQALELLNQDLDRAYSSAKRYFDKKGINLDELSAKRVEIVLDFTLNGCLHTHKKMMTAVIEEDREVQKVEYRRYAVLNGVRVALTDRNTRFYNRYLI